MNEKWFLNDIPSIEKKLKTNAASGLSPKAARSRYKKENSSFYIRPRKKISSMLIEVVSDFSLALLMICSIIALCFTEYLTGITLTAVIILNLAACVFIYFRAQRTFESLSAVFRPSAAVIRSGKAFSVDAERVVPGDVVLIAEGDILCFDARLVTSDNLRVMVRVDRETEELAEKAAEGCVRENENDVRGMVNMIHAGSRVISGSARAIVTATGRYTYYGAMTGGIRLPERKVTPHGLRLLRKYCSAFGMAITLITLPFSILSLMFSHGNVTLMTTFSAALAIAASSMSQLACTVCRVFFERQARAGLSAANAFAVRNAEIMDRLVSVEYLFLLDGSAVGDGVLHYYKAINAEGELASPDVMSRSMTALAELAALYNTAEKNTLTTGVHAPGRFTGALGEFISKGGIDSEALKIRCNILGYVPANSADKTDKLFYNDRGVKYILSVSQNRGAIEKCDRAYFGDGIKEISDEGRASIAATYDRYTEMGMKALVFTLSEGEFSQRQVFAGMIVLSERLDSSFENAVEGMKKLGVKTLSFVSTQKNPEYGYSELPAPSLGASVSAEDFTSRNLPLYYKLGSFDTYRDFSPDQISELIKFLHSKNKKVAVLCFSELGHKLTEEPDVFVTCAELKYRFSGHFEEEIEAIEVPGGAQSRSCRQDVKAEADVIIPRPSRSGGGLMSLGRAFALSGAAYNNLSCFFRYVLCSQFIRLVMVMLPMIFGEAFLDARHALFCGFIVDISVMLIFAFEMCGAENAKGFKSISGEFRSPVRNNAGMITASSAGALIAVLLPNIVGFTGVFGQYFYQSEYLFISMILLHITVMYCIRIDNFRRFGSISVNKFAIGLDVFALVFIILCFAIEKFGFLFEMAEITLPYLLLTPIPAVVSAALYFLIGNLRLYAEEENRTNK